MFGRFETKTALGTVSGLSGAISVVGSRVDSEIDSEIDSGVVFAISPATGTSISSSAIVSEVLEASWGEAGLKLVAK